MKDKIIYLLRTFPNTEWSGPAFYKVDKKQDDFPLKVTLLYFVPIDLGDSTSTELDGEELGKMLYKLYKQKPELKDCALGLIHSHHTLGAFFSGTDKDTALENATNTGLYFSTVVASEKKKCVFGFSYRDRLGIGHFIEGKVVKPMRKIVVDKQWKEEANTIKAKAKKETKNSWANYGYRYYDGYNVNQRSMFNASPATKALSANIVEDIDNEDLILNAIDAYIISSDFRRFKLDLEAIDKNLDATTVIREYYKENSINKIGI